MQIWCYCFPFSHFLRGNSGGPTKTRLKISQSVFVGTISYLIPFIQPKELQKGRGHTTQQEMILLLYLRYLQACTKVDKSANETREVFRDDSTNGRHFVRKSPSLSVRPTVRPFARAAPDARNGATAAVTGVKKGSLIHDAAIDGRAVSVRFGLVILCLLVPHISPNLNLKTTCSYSTLCPKACKW